MKMGPAGLELFNTDERTGRHYEANNRFPQFFPEPPNNEENKRDKRERKRERERGGGQVKHSKEKRGKKIKEKTIN